MGLYFNDAFVFINHSRERIMPFFGEVFSSEIIRKPVLDPKGEELGKVRDLVIVKGDPLPRISATSLW